LEHCLGRVAHSHVEDGIHLDRHVISSDYVLRWDVQRGNSERNPLLTGEPGGEKNQSWTFGAPELSKEEGDPSLVLTEDPQAEKRIDNRDRQCRKQKVHMPSPGKGLDNHRGTLAATDAGAPEAITPTTTAQRMQEMERDAGTTCAQWVADRD